MIYSTLNHPDGRPLCSGIINEFNWPGIIQTKGYSGKSDQFAEFFYNKR